MSDDMAMVGEGNKREAGHPASFIFSKLASLRPPFLSFPFLSFGPLLLVLAFPPLWVSFSVWLLFTLNHSLSLLGYAFQLARRHGPGSNSPMGWGREGLLG